MRPHCAQRGSTPMLGTGICCSLRQTIQPGWRLILSVMAFCPSSLTSNERRRNRHGGGRRTLIVSGAASCLRRLGDRSSAEHRREVPAQRFELERLLEDVPS